MQKAKPASKKVQKQAEEIQEEEVIIMLQQDRIKPTPGYRCKAALERVRPRVGFKPSSLHTRALPSEGIVRSIDAEWCPICLGRKISEKLVSGKPIWHCDECENEW